MTKVQWDQVGERLFETGIDRGVLYLQDTAVAWSGLTALEEDSSGTASNPHYMDGVKYLDSAETGDFAATLKAFTYPDEFIPLEGVTELYEGLYADNQPPQSFGLSYRSRVGNDLDGTDHGYRIHLLYNLVAVPEETGYDTMGDQNSAMEFSWPLTATPESVVGYRPTAHAVLDSRLLHPELLSQIEDVLYGSDISDPYLPSLNDLTTLMLNWHLITITDHGDGTWSATGPETLIVMLDATTFEINEANAVFLDANTYEITHTD